MIPRAINTEFHTLLSEYPVVAVLGPRQAGKTTLAKTLAGYDYVNLENPENRFLASEDPIALFQRYPGKLIIDEIQRVPELLSRIQEIVDNENAPGRFVITGSHQLQLRESISQSLAGRIGMLTLLPFSIEELNSAGISFDQYSDYAFTGFLPGVHDRQLRPAAAYENYYRTYVERDVRMLVNLKNAGLFEKFIRLLAGRTGQLLNISSLGNDVGVDGKTITHWLSILEASHIIFKLPPYHENFGKRLIKSPKYYFIETGLLTYLLDIESSKQVSRDPLTGNIFENIVVMECVKAMTNQGRRPNLHFIRDSNGNEIDIIFKKQGVLTAVEIKSSSTFNPVFFRSMEKLHLNGIPVKKQIVVYAGKTLELSSGNLVVNYCNANRIFNSES
jgi:predicted AAA+ superfamily ATPase